MMPTHFSEKSVEILDKLEYDIQYCLKYNTELEPESSIYVEGLCRRVNHLLHEYRSKIDYELKNEREKIANQIWQKYREEWVSNIKNKDEPTSFLMRMNDECQRMIDAKTEEELNLKSIKYAPTIKRKVRELGGMVYIRSSSKKESSMVLEDIGIYHEDILINYIKKHTCSIDIYGEWYEIQTKMNEYGIPSSEKEELGIRSRELHARWQMEFVKEGIKPIDYHLEKLRRTPHEYSLKHSMQNIFRVLSMEHYYHDTKVNLMTPTGYITFDIEWYNSLARFLLPESILKTINPIKTTKDSSSEFYKSLREHLSKYIQKILDELYPDGLFYLTPFTWWDNNELYPVED